MTRRTEAAPADLVRFEWPRMEEMALYDVDGRRILAGYPNDASYTPLRSEPALFEEFAALADDAEALIAFARAYGDLDESADVPVAPIVEGWNNAWDGRSRSGVLIGASWPSRSISGTPSGKTGQKPCWAASWWSSDLPELQRRRGGYEQGPQRVEAAVLAPLGGAVHELWLSRPHLAEAEKYHEAVGVPYQTEIAYLERRNLSPKAIARAALAQLVSTYCADLSVAMVVTTSPGAPLRMTYQVRSLIAAMWLQLALAIDGEREYRACPVCGRWWDATRARSDKLTCSDRCRKSRQREMNREPTEEAG